MKNTASYEGFSSVIETTGLSKTFGEFVAVKDLHLEVKRGDVFGFLGPNGSGKTTTIRMLLGLIRPSTGHIRIFGLDTATHLCSILPRLGAIVEGPTFYPYLSGRKNLRSIAAASGMRLGKFSLRRIDEMLDLVDLRSQANDAYRTYSLGMKQRLAIAAALLTDPELILLDEPTNGLDPAGVHEIRQMILRLAEQGKTIFLSSHVLFEVQQVCNRVAILHKGNLILHWLPERTPCTTLATSTETASATYTTPAGRVMCALAPIRKHQQQAIGTIYVQVLELPQGAANLWQTASEYVPWGLLFLGLTLPMGAIFGVISTRGLVQRVRRLVVATTQFAEGHYAQHVLITHNDEVSQLEYHFNRMAEQLAESITRRQELAEHTTRLEERARISRELHDAISQELFSLRTLTDGLQTAIQAGAQMIDCQPRIAMLEQTTNSMTREMRALLLEMRPPQLEGLGLAEALEALADAYTLRLGIAVTTSIVPVALSIPTEQSLLRIAQEALTNAARHTNATMITLELAQKEQMVSLRISDNGQGFKRGESGKQHGLGLHLMQERVEELHGSFLLDTVPGKGTCIALCVPQEARA